MKDLACPKCGAGSKSLLAFRPVLASYLVDPDGSLTDFVSSGNPVGHYSAHDYYRGRCLACNSDFYFKECENCGDVMTATRDGVNEETCNDGYENEFSLEVTFQCPACLYIEKMTEEHRYTSAFDAPGDGNLEDAGMDGE